MQERAGDFSGTGSVRPPRQSARKRHAGRGHHGGDTRDQAQVPRPRPAYGEPPRPHQPDPWPPATPAPAARSSWRSTASTTRPTARPPTPARGHPPPRLKRCQDGSLALLNGAQGLPLGVLEEEEYPSSAPRLIPGDQVIFSTDGVTEALHPQGRMFGLDELDRALVDCGVARPTSTWKPSKPSTASPRAKRPKTTGPGSAPKYDEPTTG